VDPIRDIQVPMNRGSIGARELNERLQAALNPLQAAEMEVERFGFRFRVRDKVIQTENNYDNEVFNGDIGQIESINPMEREVAVRYDSRLVTYDYGELDEVSLAYAISIHKSQGSEFPVVVIPLAIQHICCWNVTSSIQVLRAGRRWSCWSESRKHFKSQSEKTIHISAIPDYVAD
jgi:exodeoxyribonuclease V alpha subunit